MSPVVVLTVLAAAALHAGWNAVTKGASDRLALIGRMSVVGSAISTVLVPWTDAPDMRSWLWLGVSGVVHAIYTLLLVAAYRIGDFNQAYPIARGVGPFIVAVFAMVVLNERLPAPALAGVGLVAGGVIAIGTTAWRQVRANVRALGTAALTGVAIAAYTVIDGIGVRRSNHPVGYALWLVLLQGALTAVGVLAVKGKIRWRDGNASRHAGWGVGAAVGGMAAFGYGLILWAQFSGALAVVAALREVSVVFAAIIGATVFHEPAGRRRVFGSCLVAVGCVLLSVPNA